MKNNKIKRSALATGLPIQGTILAFLLIDYCEASDITCGIIYTIMVIYYGIIIENWIDQFEKNRHSNNRRIKSKKVQMGNKDGTGTKG